MLNTTQQKFFFNCINAAFVSVLMFGCGSSSSGKTDTPNVVKFLQGGTMQGSPLNLSTKVTTFAGSGTAGVVDGTGVAASINGPVGMTTDGSCLYVADQINHKIRKIVIATGIVSTVAGTGVAGAVDGTGTAASFNFPYGITNDGTNLYVSDQSNHKIRKIEIATGVVSTLAGSGVAGNGNGIGREAAFNSPADITTDGSNLYVTEPTSNRIRKIVIASGLVTSVAEIMPAIRGSAGGTVTVPLIFLPYGITTDGSNLYVAYININEIRKIEIASGLVTTLAGSGAVGGTGTDASLHSPRGITTDGSSLYVSENGSHKIRKIVIATGVVTTVAGSGVAGAVDGTGTAASFNQPYALTTDGSSLFVADNGNNKIRRIQ